MDKRESARAGIRRRAPDSFKNRYTRHFNLLNETVKKTFAILDLFSLFCEERYFVTLCVTFMPPEPKVIMLQRPQTPQIKALRLSQANLALFWPFYDFKWPKKPFKWFIYFKKTRLLVAEMKNKATFII